VAWVAAVEEGFELRFGFAGLLFGQPALTAVLGLAQGPFHGRGQPRQVVFYQVIVGARTHGAGGRLLADQPRHDDKRHVKPRLLYLRQGHQCR
jgi:hypothetical protein